MPYTFFLQIKFDLNPQNIPQTSGEKFRVTVLLTSRLLLTVALNNLSELYVFM